MNECVYEKLIEKNRSREGLDTRVEDIFDRPLSVSQSTRFIFVLKETRIICLE